MIVNADLTIEHAFGTQDGNLSICFPQIVNHTLAFLFQSMLAVGQDLGGIGLGSFFGLGNDRLGFALCLFENAFGSRARLL